MTKRPIESISLIVCPYKIGIPEIRVNTGSPDLLTNGLVGRLEAFGYTVNVNEIKPAGNDVEGDINRSFDIVRRIASAVASAIKSSAFPIVLSGNRNASVGVAAGLSDFKESFDVVWFDAHPDPDTFEEHLSGHPDETGVSTLTGESWKALVESVPGYRSIPMEKFTFCGARDLSEAQRVKLEKSSLGVVYGNTVEKLSYSERLSDVLDTESGNSCLVHVDLDCLDSSIGQVNYFNYHAPSGGLGGKDLMECLDVLSRERMPLALSVASFDPALEGGKKVAEVAVNAISRLMLLLKHDEMYS